MFNVDGNGKHLKKINYHQAEWQFHLSVYHTRPEANAVVHNHSIHCAGLSIPRKTYSCTSLHGSRERHRSYSLCTLCTTFGSHGLASYVAAGIKESKAILLAHHGLITCGENLDKAFMARTRSRSISVLVFGSVTLYRLRNSTAQSKEQMQVVLGKFHTYGLRVLKNPKILLYPITYMRKTL